MKNEGVFSKLQDKVDTDVPSTTERLLQRATGASRPKKSVKTPRHQDTTIPPTQEVVIETIRKAVKQLGKEAATYRFTKEEKAALADVVYTYNRQGIRTSENEIARTSINYLLEDYKANGKQSILARVLEALNA